MLQIRFQYLECYLQTSYSDISDLVRIIRWVHWYSQITLQDFNEPHTNVSTHCLHHSWHPSHTLIRIMKE